MTQARKPSSLLRGRLASEPFEHLGGLFETTGRVRPSASVALNELDHDVVGRAFVAIGERVIGDEPSAVGRCLGLKGGEQFDVPVARERGCERGLRQCHDAIHTCEAFGIDPGVDLADEQGVCELDALHHSSYQYGGLVA